MYDKNEYTSVKEIIPNFLRKETNWKFATIAYVNNEALDMVNVAGLV